MCVLSRLDQATSDGAPPWVGPNPWRGLPPDQTTSQFGNAAALLMWLVAVSTHANGPHIDVLL